MSNNIPLNLYYISQDSNVWRKTYLLLNEILETSFIFDLKEIDLNKRDLLTKYGIPIEAWIDFRIIERWFKELIPIPLISMFNFILSLQNSNGSFSIDGVIPNSGATYRTIELALLLGLHNNEKILKATNFLIESLENGGLKSPGPVKEAIPEVGTTARFLHILARLQRSYRDKKMEKALLDMRDFLLSRVYISDYEAAWHTDLLPSEIKNIDECITGATSLALYALTIFSKEKDKWLINKVSRWLVRNQKDNGGWSDSLRGVPNVDNTFNVIRALKYSLPFLEDDLKELTYVALEKAKEFLNSINPYELKTVSLRAMLLRSRLLLSENPISREVLEALDALVEIKDKWYNLKAHLYNEILIAGLAIAEWINEFKKLLKRNVKLPKDIYRRESLRFLYTFPVEIPPFYPGYKEGVKEIILNTLVKLKLNHLVIEKILESLTIKDFVSIIISTFLMIGIFFNEDFLKALILPNAKPIVNLYTTIFIVFIYSLWLLFKFKLRNNIFHFFVTTFLTNFLSYFLIVGWLQFGNDLVLKVLQGENFLAKLRLIITFSLIIDVGRKLIDLSSFDKILLRKD